MATTTRDDDICVWTISDIARRTGFSRNTIRYNMDLYESSRGAFGLAFIRATQSDRRRARKSMVLAWMQQMERAASHHE